MHMFAWHYSQKQPNVEIYAIGCAKYDGCGNVSNKNELCKMYTFLIAKLFKLVVDNNKHN